MTRRILVIEDQEDNRRIVRDLLTSAGYESIEVDAGEEAAAVAQTQHPDLILIFPEVWSRCLPSFNRVSSPAFVH